MKRMQVLRERGTHASRRGRGIRETARAPHGHLFIQQRSPTLPEPYEKAIRENKAAWEFFQAQPPSYRKLVCWWITAQKEETRAKRIEKLIAFSARQPL